MQGDSVGERINFIGDKENDEKTRKQPRRNGHDDGSNDCCTIEWDAGSKYYKDHILNRR